MRFTEKLRMYWDDLFYPALVERLETDLLMARSDIQQMKLDKDATIAELRAEKAQLSAKCMLYESNINLRVGISPASKRLELPHFADFSSPSPKTRWQMESDAHDARMAKEREEEDAAKAKAAKGV
jgi:outer membrane protein TolC